MLQKPRFSLNPAVEILLIVILALIAEWVVLPLFGKNYFAFAALVPVSAIFVIMCFSHRARGETPRDLGWRIDNLPKAFALLAAPMLAAALFLFLIGWLSGSLYITEIRLSWSLLFTFFWMFVWALIQQYPLQGFINRRAQMIWGQKSYLTTVFTAGIFALLHLPNFWLMTATFCGGLLWSWTYQRAPNLFAIALSHSLMTIVLVTSVPYTSLRGLRVGYGYFL